MDQDRERMKIEEDLAEWERENITPEMLKWARFYFAYEEYKARTWTRRITRCFRKGWMKELKSAIQEYKRFIGIIKEKYDRRITIIRSIDSEPDSRVTGRSRRANEEDWK